MLTWQRSTEITFDTLPVIRVSLLGSVLIGHYPLLPGLDLLDICRIQAFRPFNHVKFNRVAFR